jgi:hypothetical protein
MVNSID